MEGTHLGQDPSPGEGQRRVQPRAPSSPEPRTQSHAARERAAVLLLTAHGQTDYSPSLVHGSTRRFSGPDFSSFPLTSQA